MSCSLFAWRTLRSIAFFFTTIGGAAAVGAAALRFTIPGAAAMGAAALVFQANVAHV